VTPPLKISRGVLVLVERRIGSAPVTRFLRGARVALPAPVAVVVAVVFVFRAAIFFLNVSAEVIKCVAWFIAQDKETFQRFTTANLENSFERQRFCELSR